MSALALHAGAARAIFMRDYAIFASYRMRFFTTVFSTLVSMTLFYYVSRLVRSDKVGTPDDYYAFHLQVIQHGRQVCHARNPACEVCVLQADCDYYQSVVVNGEN